MQNHSFTIQYFKTRIWLMQICSTPSNRNPLHHVSTNCLSFDIELPRSSKSDFHQKYLKFEGRNTYKVDPFFGKPMETLEKEQEGEQCHKARTEVIPEHSERQASLRHCIP